MGAHGHRGVKDLIFGNTINGVRHEVSAPVLVVGDPQPETWKILLEDSRAPTGVREVEVANGRIVAERNPNRHFAFARTGPRQQHRGQVRAGDQQNERDRAQ